MEGHGKNWRSGTMYHGCSPFTSCGNANANAMREGEGSLVSNFWWNHLELKYNSIIPRHTLKILHCLSSETVVRVVLFHGKTTQKYVLFFRKGLFFPTRPNLQAPPPVFLRRKCPEKSSVFTTKTLGCVKKSTTKKALATLLVWGFIFGEVVKFDVSKGPWVIFGWPPKNKRGTKWFIY